MKWVKKNIKSLLMLTAAMAIIGGGAIGIYLSRVETGFLVRECVKGEGVFKEVHWLAEDLPAHVYLFEEAKELEPDVKKAIEFWSPYLEWKGFVPVGWSAEGHVVLVASKPILRAENPHGDTNLKWVKDCIAKRAEVLIPMPLNAGKVRECVVAHELGHALGLGHSSDEDSVMSPIRGARFRCDLSLRLSCLLRCAYLTSDSPSCTSRCDD